MLPTIQNQITEDDGVVPSLVMSGEYERERSLARERAQVVELFRVLPYLCRVPILKLWPAGGVMPEPLSQHCARSDVLHPFVDLCFGFT